MNFLVFTGSFISMAGKNVNQGKIYYFQLNALIFISMYAIRSPNTSPNKNMLYGIDMLNSNVELTFMCKIKEIRAAA